jgi:Na+/proline symporter
VISVQHVGGIEALKSKVVSTHPDALNFFPEIGSATMPILAFCVYVAVQWWSTWYPGAEPGGGGYIAQRMLATKNEKHAVFSTLWFNIAHYALRPWPWILAALVSLVVYPDLADPKIGYPKMMVDFLPVGLKGLMIASFFAAFMSTIDTQLNWGASYIVNDFYKRFIKRNAHSSHYVLISRITVVLIMVLAGFTACWMESIKGAWELLLAIGAGTGLVYILRWYWWRINAWSEIAAMTSSLVVAVFLLKFTPLGEEGDLNWAYRMLITVSITTLIWLVVTFLTHSVEREHLIRFYKKIRPGGLWKPVREEIEEAKEKVTILRDVLNWLLGTILVYSALFGMGKIILLELKTGSIFLVVSVISGFALYKNIVKNRI